MPDYRLDTYVNKVTALEDCRFDMTLHNLSDGPLAGAVIGLTSITRMADDAQVHGADFRRRFANYHEFGMPDGLVVPPGGTWTFGFTGITGRQPAQRNDGPKSAVLIAGGVNHPVSVGDLVRLPVDQSQGPLRSVPVEMLEMPLFQIPWPAGVDIDAWREGMHVSLGDGGIEDRRALMAVADLHSRLHSDAAAPLTLGNDGIALHMRQATLGAEAFTLSFTGGGITLEYGDAAGRHYGLVSVAQMVHAALAEPDRFRIPSKGRITDAPRFGWRGSHLDVSRHFWSAAQVCRFIDTMAWAKMNRFQWHLTDDEGWRFEVDAFPELVEIGSRRGPDCRLPGQYAHAHRQYDGHYTKDQIRHVVGHAASLFIDTIPEIDIPGHCTAVLAALPHLVDPDEPADSYRSVQGYPNNALNPALPQTWDFLEKVLAEVAELFPAKWVHVGADEVADGSWLTSPRIQVLAQSEGLQGTAAIQSWFLRRVQKILRGHGKDLAGWDEVSHGAGVDTMGTLLVAWQRPELVPALTAQGYRVVASPGQAYYLDMTQADGWNEPGTNWAGTVTPEACYAYDPEGDLDEGSRGALAGVQACIWCEHIHTPEIFNHMVYPRLHAVAEAGWTPQSRRDWGRFATLSALMPKL
ncbi:beta-N-acetylhexosaminidase [Falsirhodobacter sp. alg1]|uniref:beta-N-acetylhexosaminidase n=1 Tax=Falsirhodobacter sp. alg1 TaxID=1472418 RepID=UPI0005F04C8B|nr:family 20 glycosylhydrolase [Falsirhodobacter sp. alg1]